MKIEGKHIFFAIGLVLFFLVLANPSFAQCSMCRKIASDGNGKREVGNNINYAIMYLMTIPYFALAFIFRKQLVTFYRQLRSK